MSIKTDPITFEVPSNGGYNYRFNECVEQIAKLIDRYFDTDIEQLEAHISNKSLPDTQGFFFGNDSYSLDEDAEGNKLPEGDYYYKETDLQFIEDARQALQDGKKVFYDSWW